MQGTRGRRRAFRHFLWAFRRSSGLEFQARVLAAVAVTITVLLVLVQPWLEWMSGPWMIASRFAGGILTIGVLLFVVAHLMQRIRLGKFLGLYTYESRRRDGGPERYALAEIYVLGMAIGYRVDFFATEKDRHRHMFNQEPSGGEVRSLQTGWAHGIAADKSPDPVSGTDQLWVMYEGENAGEDFYGVIRLRRGDVSSWDHLVGRWYSLRDPESQSSPPQETGENLLVFTRVVS